MSESIWIESAVLNLDTKLAFNSRVRTYVNLQNADAEVRRVRQIHERARTHGRLPTERVGHTVSLVSEASYVMSCLIVSVTEAVDFIGRAARFGCEARV